LRSLCLVSVTTNCSWQVYDVRKYVTLYCCDRDCEEADGFNAQTARMGMGIRYNAYIRIIKYCIITTRHNRRIPWKSFGCSEYYFCVNIDGGTDWRYDLDHRVPWYNIITYTLYIYIWYYIMRMSMMRVWRDVPIK
jgi:hypothetical protein